MAPAGFGLIRQQAKSPPVLGLEPGALALRPALELRLVLEIEAVQERAAVQRHGALQVAGREPASELDDIGLNDGRIEAKRVGADHQRRRELPPERVDQLLQRVTRALARALGPQHGDQLVPGSAALTGCGQEREQGEPPALRHEMPPLVVGQDQAAERLEPEHEPRLTCR